MASTTPLLPPDVMQHRRNVSSNSSLGEISPTSGIKRKNSRLGIDGSLNPGTTPTQTTFNLVKNIAGAGVLSLPSGVGAGTGLVPAATITFVLGVWSGWTFYKLGEMCDRNNALTFSELGEKVSGKGFAKLLTSSCVIKTFFSCLVYSLVICDSWTQILVGFGFDFRREQVLLGMTLFVLLPLCLMEDLSILAYTSLLGSVGMIYTAGFMTVRLYDESYLPGGQFYDSVKEELHPNFQSAPGLFAVDFIQTPILISLLSTAYIAHYNAPKFYEQLADRSPGRFSKISLVSFSICILVFLVFMVVGYQTFGINSQGFILNNYSPFDELAIAARTAIGSSIVLTYPLPFTGLRAGIEERCDVNRTLLTIGLLTIITGVDLVVTDVGFVNALQGAILGSAIIYSFPGMIFVYYSKKVKGTRREAGRGAVCFYWVTVMVGVVLGLAGATLTVVRQFFPKLLPASG